MSYPGDWSEVRLGLTFDWNDQLRDDGQDLLAPPPRQQVVNSLQERDSSEWRTERDGLYLDGKEDVRVLCLPQPIKEKWQIIVIVQRLQRDFPRDPVAPAVVLERYRKVSPVVALSEG